MFCWVKQYVIFAGASVSSWSGALAQKASGMFNSTGSTIVYWVVLVIMMLVLVVVLYVIPLGIILGGGGAYIRSKLFNKAAKWIMILSGIALIALSSECVGFHLPVNVFILWLGIQLLYPLIMYVLIPLAIALYNDYYEMSYERKKEFWTRAIYVAIVIVAICVIYWTITSFLRDVSEIFGR